jgi:hypothetical protein
VLNLGIWQPNYHQGKRLPNKERNKKKDENKTCLLFAYCHVTTTIMQQLPSCKNYHLAITNVMQQT